MNALQRRLMPVVEALVGQSVNELRIEPLQGDASTRRYSRLHLNAGSMHTTFILVEYPDENHAGDELGANKLPSYRAFAEIADFLAKRGIRVPQIEQRLDQGQIMILADLGEVSYFQRLQSSPRSAWKADYLQAVDQLATIHQSCWPLPAGHVIATRHFDQQLLASELEHFREWGCLELFGAEAASIDTTLNTLFAQIVAQIVEQPTGFVHRDYQSKNLLWDKTGQLYVIDFQDALTGPRLYDLVALLCDSYVDLDEPLQLELIERYRQRMGLPASDSEKLVREFWWLTLQRKLKDAGRFVFIDRVRKNPRFLPYYPQSLVYVGRALQRLGLHEVHAQFGRVIAGFADGVAVPAAKS